MLNPKPAAAILPAALDAATMSGQMHKQHLRMMARRG
jgi:hypothetical protein